jgi:hypothetical protein
MALRVYSAGAIVIHTVSSVVELPVTVTEDTNNYADALSTTFSALLTQAVAEDTNNYADAIASTILGTLFLQIAEDSDNYADAFDRYTPTLHFTENINNWADAIGIVGLDYALLLKDFIPALIDKLEMFFPATLGLSDDIDNWLDAIATTEAGKAQLGPGDSINNLSDAVQFIMGLELRIKEAIKIQDYFDTVRVVKGTELSLADDTDNYGDAITLPGIGLDTLALQISDSINNFQDAISTQFPRVNSARRALQTPYIRRYLNDVEVD